MSPQYAQAYAANCDPTPPVVTAAVVAANPAAKFLAAAPCDANGNPLPAEKRPSTSPGQPERVEGR